jgi:eukaryotic-like serine/threonine-protein kinase
MNFDSLEDDDIRLFGEEYPAVYEFVLKVLDGHGDDALLQAFANEHGEASLEYFLKILSGKASGKDIQEFGEEFGDELCNVILKMVQKKKRQHKDLAESGPLLNKFQKGDFIGQQYEVFDVLGKGGFGVVYLVYSHSTKSAYALKTFRDEYLEDIRTRERFRKEAQVWIDLDRHPYLVRAYLVDEFSGRLYIKMEYIAPDEQGLNTLDAYLRMQPPDLAQSLRWAIQFCYGMEHAYSKGIKAHRDIKPANIMISHDKTVKISDFGLAGIINTFDSGLQCRDTSKALGSALMKTVVGSSIGTPEYMSPEQFADMTACNERSDIYSFGIVLYQTASKGKLPFSAENPQVRWSALRYLHEEALVPKLTSQLFPVVQRCLAKEPARRYQTFSELRKDLEFLLKRESGEIVKIPDLKELDALELLHKGNSLWTLGKNQDAIEYFDRALEINPRDENALHNKGSALDQLGKYQDAIECYNRALQLNPKDENAWNSKGNALYRLGKHQGAIECYDRALQLKPGDENALHNKGSALDQLGKHQDAIECYDRVLELNPKAYKTWYNKGATLGNLGRHQEKLECYDRALKINPVHAAAWANKGLLLSKLGRHQEAIACCSRALEIAPKMAEAWRGKGNALYRLGKYREAVGCYDKTLEITPGDATAWNNKGMCLKMLGKSKEAIVCFDQASKIDPNYAQARANKKSCRTWWQLLS